MGDNRKVYLIDAPAFGDTHKSDTDILREIAGYLGFIHKRNIRLSGIIFLHSITDTVLQVSALMNLKMLRMLCGDSVLGSVILVTSWWNKVDPKLGEERETQLKGNQDWIEISGDNEVFRHNGSKETAFAAVSYLLSKNQPIVLDIQGQMINQEKKLNETPAGLEVEAKLTGEKRESRIELKKAFVTSYRTEEFRELRAKGEKIINDLHRLKENIETLILEREQAMKGESVEIPQAAKSDE